MAERFHTDTESSSDSCASSSYSESDDEYEPPWLDNIDTEGNLFYLDPGLLICDSQNETKQEENHLQKENEKSLKSRLNPATKLRKWMTKHNRKSRKSFSSQESLHQEPQVPFINPQIALASADLYLEVDLSRQNVGRRTTLAMELLGMEIGPFKEKNNPYMEDKVQILGFAYGRKYSSVETGNWLAYINDEPINIHNIDDVLKKLVLPSIVKLTIFSLEEKIELKNECHSELVSELLRESKSLDSVKSSLLQIPVGVYYLVMNDESNDDEGVVYRFPDEDTSLFKLKGMFLTLSHMIGDVASPNLIGCSVIVEEKLVHVGFVKEENETFVFAFPADYATSFEVRAFTTNIAKMFKFQFSSLKNAFSPERKEDLNHFFVLFYKYHILNHTQVKGHSSSHLLNILPSVQWLPLTIDIKTEIDDILTELESADFGVSSEGFFENQRLYYILGSCLFYKGYLLTSHLPKTDLLDTYLFLQYNHILRLTKKQTVSEMIVWQEVFPSSLQSRKVCDSEFNMSPGRRIFLTVAMNQTVLSVMLEATNYSKESETFLFPEQFYIEEAQNTLIILHDCGILSAAEKQMNTRMPPVMSNNFFSSNVKSAWKPFSSLFPHRKVSKKHVPLPSSSSISGKETGLFNFTKNPQQPSTSDKLETDLKKQLPTDGPLEDESDSESSYSECSDGSSSYLERTSHNYSCSASSTSESLESSESAQPVSSVKDDPTHSIPDISKSLGHGESMLIQYLDMDPVEGIFLAPILNDRDLIEESTLNEIWNIFHRCCLQMRSVFARSLRNKEIIKSSTVTKFGVSKFLSNAYEQGTLFKYKLKEGSKHKSALNSMSFWVIGRLLFTPEPREIYMCYHDSVHYDIVEFAIQMGFGLSL